MPYITQRLRDRLDSDIERLSEVVGDLCESEDIDPDGMLNYCITRLLLDMGLTRYATIERAVGVLECAKLELYRKVAAPYEDKKAGENGEVY